MKKTDFRCMNCQDVGSIYSMRWKWMYFKTKAVVKCGVCIECSKSIDKVSKFNRSKKYGKKPRYS
jgi:hypothetical protein